jgi:hypothetical protein
MSLTTAIATFVFGLIAKEAPKVAADQERAARYMTDISTLVAIHTDVADGRLINKDMDALILTAVNYRESRLKNPSEDGDCHLVHALQGLPSVSWPKGYKPVYTKRCNAVGPMQLAVGHRANLPSWQEVSMEFSADRGWDYEEAKTWKNNPFTVDDLRDPRTNVRIAYAELVHWKYACVAKDGAEAPVGVWLTAYRYGSCPSRSKATGRYYIDAEAKKRCSLVAEMARELTSESSALVPVRCDY